MNAIDMSFRPDSYWPKSLTPEQLLSRIRGKTRQDIARRIYEAQGFRGLNAFLVKEGLTGEERSAWGGVGPWCMGGEYLPALYEGEVEIARISMASTTSDQISVRARRTRTDVRIVDDGHGFEVSRALARAAQRGRLGLVGIAERVRMLGGTFEVDSAPGGPTTLRLSLPRWEPFAPIDADA